MAEKRKISLRSGTTRIRGAYRTAPDKDAGKIIDAYIRRRSVTLRPVVKGIRRLVKTTVAASREAVNPWGIPTFDFHVPLCFMMNGMRHVTFGFPRGAFLADPAGLLEGTGKYLRHVKLREGQQLRDSNLRRLILQAASLNRKTPLTPSMRVKESK